MFFEGTEKKVEIVVNPHHKSLRGMGKSFWNDVVHASKAEILSQLSSDKCDAYLLSESSLFVWDDRLTMITCGRTVLAKAVETFLKKVPIEAVDCLVYERKNEHFPHQQPSNFFSDVGTFRQHMPGQSLQFGEKDEHHLQLFHLDKKFNPSESDLTVEVLMYGIQGRAKEIFATPNQTPSAITKSGVRHIFEGFEVDDHIFSPVGYSLNALKNEYYYTFHVTPENIGSYVSFETNYVENGHIRWVVEEVVDLFQPRSFDVILFHNQRDQDMDIPSYNKHRRVCEHLSCGYNVEFTHYYEPQKDVKRAIYLDI